MNTTQQPEALRLAELCDNFQKLEKIGTELRRQHARIAELEAQLSAIGAGGVEPVDDAIREVMHLIDDWSEKDFMAAEARLDPWSEHDPSAPVQMLEKLDKEANAARLAIEQKLRAMLTAAPQPPEVGCSVSNAETEDAPVQMPEPLARIEGGGLKWHIPDAGYSLPVHNLKGTHNLYTEHQVRQLLADQAKQGGAND